MVYYLIISIMTSPRNLNMWGVMSKQCGCLILWIFCLSVIPVLTQILEPPLSFQEQPSIQNIIFPTNRWFLSCQADSSANPPPVYSWIKDGQYILTNASRANRTLTTYSATVNDTGVYQCAAANALGAVLSDSVRLNIAYFGSFAPTISPTTKAVSAGRHVILPVPFIQSTPPAEIDWLIGGVMVQETLYQRITLDNQIVLLQVSSGYSNVQCKASNSFFSGDSGEVYGPVYTVVLTGSSSGNIGPDIVVPPKDTNVTVGGLFDLECVVNAKPMTSLSITWFIIFSNGSISGSIESGNRYTLSTYRRQLTVSNVAVGDSGIYVCQASLSQPGFTVVNASARVNVHVRPSFPSYYPTGNFLLSKEYGSSVTLTCEGQGVPTPTVTWYKNAQPIGPNPRYSWVNQTLMTITSLIADDAGVYQCFVTNDAGQINIAAYLQVFNWNCSGSVPVIGQPPTNQTVIQGDPAVLSCVATGAPPPKITWTKASSSGQLTVLADGQNRVQLHDGYIVISPTMISDQGQYTCTANNTKGSAQAQAWLIIIIRTAISSPPQTGQVIKGTAMTLACGVTKDPTVTVNWIWTKTGTSGIPGYAQVNQVTGSLSISPVSSAETGVYTCTVNSTGGTDTKSANITVIELPSAPGILSAVLLAGPGRPVQVTWYESFDGNTPIVNFNLKYRLYMPNLADDEAWLPLNASLPGVSSSYLITGVLRPARQYQFVISAQNKVGVGPNSGISKVVTIPEEPPSGPPLNVQAVARSNSSILVTWLTPSQDQQNGILLGYMVRYQLSGYSDDTQQYVNSSGLGLQLLLTRLLVNQGYSIAVAAYTAPGVGVYSSSVQVATSEGIPSQAPDLRTAVPITSTAINLTWSPPPQNTLNGKCVGYLVVATALSTGDNTNSTYPPQLVPGSYNVLLSGLVKFTSYEVLVYVLTSAGSSPPSNALYITTLQDVPGPIQNLQVDEITDQSIAISWDPPLVINGILTGFSVRCWRSGTVAQAQPVTLNASLYNITGLSAKTNYTIVVRARTVIGEGEPTQQVVLTTPPAVSPGMPRILNITDISAYSGTVLFVPGDNGYAKILLWIIEAQKQSLRQRRQADGTWAQIYTVSDPSAMSLVFGGLTPYSSMRVRLTAQNRVGKSTPSDPTPWFSTDAAPPASPPSNLNVLVLNQSAIRVGWTALPTDLWYGQYHSYLLNLNPGTTDIQVDSSLTSIIVNKLQEYTTYSVTMASNNEKGKSNYTTPVIATTLQWMPSAGPNNVTATALSSTSVQVWWGDVPLTDRNGVIISYKISYRTLDGTSGVNFVEVMGNSTHAAILTSLLKYVDYQIAVQAATPIGYGNFTVPINVRTLQDTPGPPSSVYFPEVNLSSAKVAWSPPVQSNGIITGYKLQYIQENSPGSVPVVISNLATSVRDYTVTGLLGNVFYDFTITASTALGWGVPTMVRMKTILDRQRPPTPYSPSESVTEPRAITIGWISVSDDNGPIRNYTIQYKVNAGGWVTVTDFIGPDLTSYRVANLMPNTVYQLRVAATNDVGQGQFSASSLPMQTKPDAPGAPPTDVLVTAINKTSVFVSWKPPLPSTWNTDALLGYRVRYSVSGAALWVNLTIPNDQVFSVALGPLQLFTRYEVQLQAYDLQGDSPWSLSATYYFEIAPTAPPQHVGLDPLSSTALQLTWNPPPVDDQNGAIQGYKIYYWQSVLPLMVYVRMALSTDNTTLIDGLDVYNNYSVVILGYNSAGDGPNITTPVTASTLQDLPSIPGPLSFMVMSLTAVNVSWVTPAYPNGIILSYLLSYYEDNFNAGARVSVQVEIKGRLFYYADGLKENSSYIFSVKAMTVVGYGPSQNGSVVTGPQQGSPAKPYKPLITIGETAINIDWQNGPPGATPIHGYIIQTLEQYDTAWTTQTTLNSADSHTSIPFANLKAGPMYQVRVIAINDKGISYASDPSDYFMLPAASTHSSSKPFYQQWWFLVIVGVAGLCLIVIIICVLCLTGRKRRDKYKDPISQMPTTTLPISDTLGSGLDMSPIEPDFATISSRRSYRRNGTLPRRSDRDTTPVYANLSSARPPRPSPGSLIYSDPPDDDRKSLPDSEGSDITDKPSDESEDESQLSDSVNQMGASASSIRPSALVLPYQSSGNTTTPPAYKPWHNPTYYSRPSAYNYPDSEQDSSQYAMSLNGGHVMMNNTAGSRAPLTGFSSFV